MTLASTLTASSSLMAGLMSCVSFEEAATQVLRGMLAHCSSALEGSRFAKGGRIAQGLVHLRPGHSYRALARLEFGATELAAIDAADTRLTSTTAWRWVAETGAAVTIDVALALVQPDGAEAVSESRLRSLDVLINESQTALLQREVSHVLVLPLRGLSGSVDGMICLEAECRAAMGTPFIWPECKAQLQLAADIAAPYLVGLPRKPIAPPVGDAFLPVVGATMARTVELLRTFAQQDEPILITGPTGAGKSRLARWCHEQSRRRGQPFEVLDLSSVPEELQMAELFGWKKGAFTGAIRDNQGYLGRARGGSLFIDEVDNLSPRAQSGLLRVLEEHSYRCLGDDRRETPADVRFIVGSNASLQSAVKNRLFRQDLYYRINVLPVQLPRLEERADEIPLWARYMVERRHERGPAEGGRASLSADAEQLLSAQAWPGNLRQLDNIVRRAYAFAVMPHGAPPPRSIVVEREHVQNAIAYERAEPASSPLEALISAAAALVAAAERSESAGRSFDLDLADGFKGFVLAAATEKLACDKDRIFCLFGKGKLLKGRNHHKLFRRELERARDLAAACGVGNFPFENLLQDAPPRSELEQPQVLSPNVEWR